MRRCGSGGREEYEEGLKAVSSLEEEERVAVLP